LITFESGTWEEHRGGKYQRVKKGKRRRRGAHCCCCCSLSLLFARLYYYYLLIKEIYTKKKKFEEAKGSESALQISNDSFLNYSHSPFFVFSLFACMRVRVVFKLSRKFEFLHIFFKVFFILKYIKIIFFLFLKNYFYY